MRGTIAIPEAEHTIPQTTMDHLHGRLSGLVDARARWATTPIVERIRLLERAIRDTRAVAEEWVEVACAAKGIDVSAPVAGEEWQSGPALTIRLLRLIARTLESIAATGSPPTRKARRREDGITTVGVFPTDLWDAMLFLGIKGEVWMQDGVTPENLKEHLASAYRGVNREGAVSLVLGAGNIASIPAMDALTKLFAENSVVLLKLNPVNEWVGPMLERALAGFIEGGFLSIAYGGADVGRFLVDHPWVDAIHLTGSDKAHDSIVFGTGEEGALRKREGRPRLEKPITSELGNVTPVIVVPGPWSESDLRFQGENIASGLTHNAGFNCVANRLLITYDGWDRRDALNREIVAALRRIPTRPAYYPGAEERWQMYVDAYGEAVSRIGVRTDEALPWTLVSVDHDDPIGMCFETECFSGVFSEMAMPASSVVDFVDRAVRFANERLWGTLGATIIVHPDSMKDPLVADAVERAIADLRYGSVSVNIWVAVAYAAVTTTWGAYPGHTLDDIQSGRGTVHNALLFDRPLKSVVRAPFRAFPKPVWFGTNRNAHRTLQALTHHEADPGILSTLKVAARAVRG